MDSSYWRPIQADQPPPVDAAGDWRAQFQPDSREKIVHKIVNTLKRCLNCSSQDGLLELKKIAARFEERIYTSATSQMDYLRRISIKMVILESKSQSTGPNDMPSNSVGGSRSLSAPAEFLPNDYSDGRTSHLEPPPMDGRDPLIPLPPMDLNYERQSQAELPLSMSGEDWRTQLLPDFRQKTVNNITRTLSRCITVSSEEGILELRKMAARFEEKVYGTAINQSDYLRKISLKMVAMEVKFPNASGSRSYHRTSSPPCSSNTGEQELVKIADKIEQNMQAAVVSQPDYIQRMSPLENAFGESKSQNGLHNSPASNSTGTADPQEQEPTH